MEPGAAVKPQSNYLFAGFGAFILAIIFAIYYILDRPISVALAVIIITAVMMVAGFFLAGPPGNRRWNRKKGARTLQSSLGAYPLMGTVDFVSRVCI